MHPDASATTPPAAPPPASETAAELHLAVIGAGPVGLALALHAARSLPRARVSVFDARPADQDVAADPRTLALSLGSLQIFQRLGLASALAAQSEPIRAVHVSQQQPALLGLLTRPLLAPATSLWPPLGRLGEALEREPEVFLSAQDQAVPQLGSVVSYGAVVAPLQAAWLAACEAGGGRLAMRFGVPVRGLKDEGGDVELDADIAERYDLAVVAEGGVFAPRGDVAAASPSAVASRAWSHDYRQTAWVGTLTLGRPHEGVAYERFTPHGPVALLPLPARDGAARAALVWCVPRDDDPVEGLNDAQRLAVLQSLLPAQIGPLVGISPLKRFPLGLKVEPTLVQGRTVRIGNAAQTLHPVAGQGLNLGLRDVMELVSALRHGGDLPSALRRVEFQRAPDRWALIATTDFLARSFTWSLPGLTTLRGAGLAALNAAGPIKHALARQMMFGRR